MMKCHEFADIDPLVDQVEVQAEGVAAAFMTQLESSLTAS